MGILGSLSKRKIIEEGAPIRLLVGSATTAQEGWIASDVTALSRVQQFVELVGLRLPGRLTLDITQETNWAWYFEPGSISNILSEHVFEHLTHNQMVTACRNAFTYLKPGGKLRVAVPDGNRPDEDYIRGVAPPADDHLQLLTIDSLSAGMAEAGFQVEPLEYYDSQGTFHRTAYDEAEGIILRCYERDRQQDFAYADHFYTSVIVDGVKV